MQSSNVGNESINPGLQRPVHQLPYLLCCPDHFGHLRSCLVKDMQAVLRYSCSQAAPGHK